MERGSVSAGATTPVSDKNIANERASLLNKAEVHAYVVTHLNEAIDNGWVQPYYQPVVRSLTGKLCGFEALARWNDPVYGLMPPDMFIPALEESRVIHLLDCSVIRQVCRQYRECADNGYTTVPVSFNLSRLDFDLCDIFSVVESAAREFDVPHRMLNIEITETVLGTDPAYMTAMVDKFHKAGYQVWMDDFGSGYSTLNVLKDHQFDELKIDMEFLSSFNEKSKTILASVVDMAKKLGIQTLAEGVETEEHRDYLRRIGCEKMQGYLFGKPIPFELGRFTQLYEDIGVETPGERYYVDKVCAVNTLSLSERDLTAGSSTTGYVTSMPLATVEYANDQFKLLEANRVFQEGLENIGIGSMEDAENRINDLHRPLARQARHLVRNLAEVKYARVDHVVGGIACVFRARHITSRDGKEAFLVSIDDTLELSERKRHERMDDMLSVMYSIYDHVDIAHIDEDYLEPVFDNVGLHQWHELSYDSTVTNVAAHEVYPRDRERYFDFMDRLTMLDRIKQGGENFLADFFRLREQGGNYVWKMVGLILITDHPGNHVLVCMRDTNWSHNHLFQSAFDDDLVEEQADEVGDDSIMTDGSLWRALIRNRHACIFWKDTDRRFVGANRGFLEYYGFDSVDAVLGKTDEDMGWHIDPAPFKNAELRVLRDGVPAENILGHCIVHGEVRDIYASKRPVYRNGRIVGLVGFFNDAVTRQGEEGDAESLPLRDPVTGVLNYTGLEAATWRYVDAYKRQGVDFAMISLNVESFDRINEVFGYAFGEKVLKRIGDELTDIAGHQRVIGHVFSERFVVLVQGESDEELQALCDTMEQRLADISNIDGTPVTIYALAGYSRFSKLGDVEAMKRHNRDRRLERRPDHVKNIDKSASDIVTSSLLKGDEA